MERTAFWATAAIAVVHYWFVEFPPMVDVPQHVAQISLFLDMLRGDSRWADLFFINWKTPYLVPYSIATLFSLMMSPLAAMKLVLSLAAAGFILAGCWMFRRAGAHRLLDWGLFPALVGFSEYWGFVTFLAASGLVFLAIGLLSQRAANAEIFAVETSCLLVVAFFSHGLIFGLTTVLLGAYWLLAPPLPRRSLWWWAPGLASVGLFAIFMVRPAGLDNDIQIAFPFSWNVQNWGIEGLGGWASYHAIMFVFTGVAYPALRIAAGAFMLLACIPWFVLGRPKLNAANVIPFVTVALVFVAVPHQALGTSFLFERFGLFTVPFYYLMWGGAKYRREPGAALGATALIAAAAANVGFVSWRFIEFSTRYGAFQEFQAAIPPGKRVLTMVEEGQRLHSELKAATGLRSESMLAYYQASVHLLAYYQARTHGLVEFNFAGFVPQIVRFRPGVARLGDWTSRRVSDRFDWSRDGGRHFDFIATDISDEGWSAFRRRIPCGLPLVAESGVYRLYAIPAGCGVPDGTARADLSHGR